MSDATPPDARQIDTLIAQLRTSREEIRQILSDTEDDSRPVDLGLPIGRLSRMDAIQQQQMSRANRALYQRRLLQIDAALKAAQNGEYGLCRDCGEAISPARLGARPETPFCVDCQEAMETR